MQQVCIDGVFSSVFCSPFGVSQGSVLGPILFNLYIQSLSDVFISCGMLPLSYADDNSGMISFSSQFQLHFLTVEIPQCISMINEWLDMHFLKINRSKTKVIIFGSPSFLSKISIQGCFLITGECIRFSSVVKYLGTYFDSELTFSDHIKSLTSSCNFHLRNIASIRRYLSDSDCAILIHSLITSRLDLCNFIFFGLSKSNLKKVQRIQNSAMRILTRNNKSKSLDEWFLHWHWLKIEQRILFKIILITFKCVHSMYPLHISSFLHVKNVVNLLLTEPYHAKSKFSKYSFAHAAPRLWNCLPVDIRLSASTTVLKKNLKTYLFSNCDDLMHNFNRYVQ